MLTPALASRAAACYIRQMARHARKDEYDSPWKEALQALLPAFLAYFFPDIHADIDWSRGYQALDKEFEKIARRAKVGKRIADKLFKVWLKDGREHWLLIHIEVQGDAEAEFPRRIFDYNSAVRQLYNKDVVSLAILTDDQPDWRPTSFSYGRWGCKMELTFRISKLLDFADDVTALEESKNPFAVVVLAHSKTRETRRDPLSRKYWKLQIIRGLFNRGWSKEEIDQLLRVIDWMMALPEDLEDALQAECQELLEVKEMRYVTSFERSALKRAEEIARRKENLKMIAAVLESKFGLAGRKLMRRARALAETEELRQFLLFLATTDSIDEAREYFSDERPA